MVGGSCLSCAMRLGTMAEVVKTINHRSAPPSCDTSTNSKSWLASRLSCVEGLPPVEELAISHLGIVWIICRRRIDWSGGILRG